MSKKFKREFEKNITKKTGWELVSYNNGGKHYICKIKCNGCELHEGEMIFPNGNGTSISSTPSASNAWNSIKSQIRKIHKETVEKNR